MIKTIDDTFQEPLIKSYQMDQPITTLPLQPNVWYADQPAPSVKFMNDPDPVPGQIYDVQITDKNNNPVHAGMLILDEDGRQVAGPWTSETGSFHYTVPDFNYERFFLQFYGDAELYNPIVKTYKEVVSNPVVILPAKNKGLSTEATLSLVGLGVAVLALSKDKKKSVGNTYVEKYKAQPVGTKLLLVGGVVAAVYYIFKYKPSAQQKEYLQEAKNMLQYLVAEYGIIPSYSMAQFSAFASQIRRAVDKCGSDEQAIYRVFQSLNNEADIYQLILSYGIAKYDGCFEGKFPSWNVHYTLTESLTSDLNDSEIRQINSILSSKNISYFF